METPGFFAVRVVGMPGGDVEVRETESERSAGNYLSLF